MGDETIQNELLLRLFDQVSDGFLILNHHREVIYFNKSFITLTGWDDKQMASRGAELISALPLDELLTDSKTLKFKASTGVVTRLQSQAFSLSSPEGDYIMLKISCNKSDDRDDQKYKTHFRELFNNVGDPLLLADIKGRIRCANPAFYDLLNYDQSDTPMNLSDVYVYEEELDDKLRQLLDKKKLYNLDTHLYTKDGHLRRVLDNSWVIRDKNYRVKGYATQFQDVTYLRNIQARLKIAERNYTLLFETLLSSIIILDIEGTILNINSMAETAYGYSWDELVGHSFDEIFPRKDLSFNMIRDLIDDGDGRFLETQVPRPCKDGSVKYSYASYTAVRDSSDEIIAYSLLEKDLTERYNLEVKLRESIKEVKQTQAAAIMGFAKLTEYRDRDTGIHLERIREYTRVLANALRHHYKYCDYITDEYIEDISLSAALHDVGKVGVEDNLLLKEGPLSDEEYDRIKEHARLGGQALSDVDSALSNKSFLTIGKEVAFYHHERWDGKGYPDGLAGEDIPLSARIVAIADVYDALTSERPYKEAYSHNKAVHIIANERGKQFDPEIVDIFMENHKVFDNIRSFTNFEKNPAIADFLPVEDEAVLKN